MQCLTSFPTLLIFSSLYFSILCFYFVNSFLSSLHSTFCWWWFSTLNHPFIIYIFSPFLHLFEWIPSSSVSLCLALTHSSSFINPSATFIMLACNQPYICPFNSCRMSRILMWFMKSWQVTWIVSQGHAGGSISPAVPPEQRISVNGIMIIKLLCSLVRESNWLCLKLPCCFLLC